MKSNHAKTKNEKKEKYELNISTHINIKYKYLKYFTHIKM